MTVGYRDLGRVRTRNGATAKKHTDRRLIALFSASLVAVITLVLPRVAAATTAGWSSGSWNGSPT